MLSTPGVAPIAAHWWIPLVRGILAIAFGIVVMAYPFHAIGVFIILFGAFVFADGVLNIITSLRFAHPDSGSWWMVLVQGIFGVAIGVLTFLWPGLTAATLGTLVALWAVVTGVLEIVAAFRLRRSVPGEILLIISGILSVVIGAWLFISPIVALLALTWLIGFYAIFGGVTLIALAFRLRRAGTTGTAPT
jgi:uncharacterized membrane protein HdeD (DUF308 family)